MEGGGECGRARARRGPPGPGGQSAGMSAMPQVRVGAAGRGAAGPLLGLEVWGSVLSACACGACLCWSWYLATRNCSQRFRANNSLNRERSSEMWALESHCPVGDHSSATY